MGLLDFFKKKSNISNSEPSLNALTHEVKIKYKDDSFDRYQAIKHYESNGFTLYLSKDGKIDKKRFIKVDLKAEIVYIDVDETYITAELLNISSKNADDYIICWGGDYYRSISIDSKYRY